ncbi:alpha-ketoglutarate-dependent dioxygenase alkB homolog 4 [Anomaloglossus baeobatrachus]|uniref:alpha-ketoglutarate-dependent dioxygenase alkB homolog 4 n=1 Tax=Anomaloglossus baeobatrachus TaxID=238106 RepID=UPI003F4F539F
MADSCSSPPGCGCKGVRSCLVCESPAGAALKGQRKTLSFVYHPDEGIAKGAEQTDAAGWWFPFPGVTLIEEFVTENEERDMVHVMDQEEWRLSQSGRKKQDFGPKVNFKKQKIKVANFNGLSSFSKVLWERMTNHAVLKGFLPVEQCNLDYSSDRGSAIDPHFDDSWLWGERLVSLNLLTDTVLTMTSSSVDNLPLISTVDQHSDWTGICSQAEINSDLINVQSDLQDSAGDRTSKSALVPYIDVEVAIHLPRRSLVVLYGDARYNWMHAIHREHIRQRRVCSTFRELSAEFSAGGKEESQGRMLLDIALGFQGKPV